MRLGNVQGAWLRWPIAVHDRLYRIVRGLDRPASQVGPALRLEIRLSRREIRLADGSVLGPGHRFGIIHLNNERIAALHRDGGSIRTVGLRFRRLFIASLRELARRAEPGGPLADVRAFAATTIFHRGLRRFGFVPALDANRVSALGVLYQRVLLATLHPAGSARLGAATYERAERLWISRTRLLETFAPAPAEAGVSQTQLGGQPLGGSQQGAGRPFEA